MGSNIFPQKVKKIEMVKKLEKWTLTLDGKSIVKVAVSVHIFDLPNDSLSNEGIFISVWRNISNRMTEKYGEVEKSILHFDAHQNPRILQGNRMKRYSNGTKYDKLSIQALKTPSVMEKKRIST